MKISEFTENHDFLSNFFQSIIEFDGVEWSTAEHLYQARKSIIPEEREFIRQLISPGKAKRKGKKLTLRAEWETVKVDIMLDCLRLKFSQNQDIALRLVNTGDAYLCEGNYWHDNYWGNCDCDECEEVHPQNNLGKCLMVIREELISLYNN